MSKNIAELVVKMKNETSLSVETMGDSTDQVFMAAIAVAHTVADASNGNRKKAEVVMTIAKAIIDEQFESIWKREYGNAPAAPTSDPAAPAEKAGRPCRCTARRRGQHDGEDYCRRNEAGKREPGPGAGRDVQGPGR